MTALYIWLLKFASWVCMGFDFLVPKKYLRKLSSILKNYSYGVAKRSGEDLNDCLEKTLCQCKTILMNFCCVLYLTIFLICRELALHTMCSWMYPFIPFIIIVFLITAWILIHKFGATGFLATLFYIPTFAISRCPKGIIATIGLLLQLIVLFCEYPG
ncbi:hypothetical protein [Maridesulfovibrio sp.]|uniref:hypothetical protein n=1 Tax=Maridesulfovibrio sp. TaxID=2795000 RepID=UPI0029C9DF18|nr:hypothetical protein [Maridesulfovibrio sp.]